MQALLASYEKGGHPLRLGKLLIERGWSLLGSAGTAKHLNGNGVPCQDVAEIVGKPILDHRVVTLSREIHAALLSRPEDADELKVLGIKPIDLVYVTLYPLEKAIAENADPEEIIEKTDIGGPTLLRSAAKGGRLALSSPAQIDDVEAWLAAGAKEDAREMLVLKFRAAAERRVAEYTSAAANYWEQKMR